MPIYIEEEKERITIKVIIVVLAAIAASMVAYLLLDREPIKERQQYVIIKSVGVDHKYIVDGKAVRIEYEEVE